MILALAAFASAQSPIPGFTKSFNPGTIGPGSVSTLIFQITNTGSVGLRNLSFSDTLPAGVTLASPAQAATTCGGSVDAANGGSSVSLSGGEIAPSSTCTVLVNVTSSTPGTHTNVSGDLTSDAGNSGSATADLIVATNRPGLLKSFSPSTVLFGARSRLTLTIDNSANSSAAVNLDVTDNLPLGMVVASPSNAVTTCGGGVLTAIAGSSTIDYGPAFFGDATVAAGSSCTVEVDVLGNAVGPLGNVTGDLTSVQGFGAPVSSGKASAILQVTVDRISLAKSFVDDPVPPGGTVTMELTVRNLDRFSSATNIAFTDDLSAVLAGLAAVGLPLSNPCGAGSQLSGTTVLSLTGGSLPPEGTCTFSVTLQVPATASSGSFTNTTSSITADVGGRPVSGSPASDQLFVAPIPLLTKTFTDDPVGAGGSVTLEFSITNTSPNFSATDIAFQDVFDVVITTASSVPAAGFCGSGASATFTALNPSSPARLVVTGASLAAGDTCTFSLTLNVALGAQGGTVPNTTSAITATVNGETLTGSPASDDLVIAGGPELVKSFTDDPVAPGGTVTLELTLTHDGLAIGDATGITFTDDLSSVLAGLEATGLPQSDVCGLGSSLSGTQTLSFTGGTLAPGASCTTSVSLLVPSTAPAGLHTNTTSTVVSTVAGVETMSNPASDILRIAGLTLTKEFTDDPVLPGGTVNLRFTVENVSPVSTATAIFFRDDLNATLNNLAATGLPLADICGIGSSLSGVSGNRLLIFQGGTLAPGESCSFDVSLAVPSGAASDDYTNTTSAFSATIDGNLVIFDNASDELTVANDLLVLSKEFTDDPVGPGETVNLRFVITNISLTETITDIAFSDDLDAALSGLASTSGTLLDICGTGSQITGTSALSFSGGNLAPGASCSFDVAVAVPSDVELGSRATNTTSEATGSAGGLPVRGDPASDDLLIDSLLFSKSFSGAATAGGTVVLSFTLENLSATDNVTGLSFSDDLSAVLAGLTALGLPAADVCGEGSVLEGTTLLALSDGQLLPGGSCTFSVTLQVPAASPAGSFLNVTSALFGFGLPVAQPATATLVVDANVDEDDDGVLNGDDVCPGTVIPESVPTRELRPNRYALVDGDTIFDTVVPKGGGPGEVFTTTDTAGCSCEQIIDALALGNGHTQFGCSLGAMRTWVSRVTSAHPGEIFGNPERASTGRAGGN